MTRWKSRVCRRTALVMAALAVTPCASSGAVRYWDKNGSADGAGGATPNGAWEDSAWGSNDDGSGTPATWSGSDLTAVFSAGTGATGSFTISVGSAKDVFGMQFEEGAVAVSGSVLTLTDPNVIVSSGASGTIGSVLDGADGLSKQSLGMLVLTANNTYSGATQVLAGTLRLSGGSIDGSSLILANAASAALDLNGATGSVGSISGGGATGGNVTLGSGGVLSAGANGATTTYAGVISGAGGQLIKNGTGTLTLTGASTYSGTTTINAGALIVGSAGSGSIVGNVVNHGALTFNRSGTLTYAGAISGTGTLTKSGSGTLVLTGANTLSGGTTISAGTVQIGAGGTTGSIAGDVVNNATLTFNRSDTLTFAGEISGSGVLSKTGAGTLVLPDANARTGSTIVGAGTLRMEHAGALGSGSITLNSGGTLSAAGVTVNRTLILNNGSTLAGTGLSAGWSGVMSVSNGASVTLNATSSGDLLAIGDSTNDLSGGGGGAVIRVTGAGAVQLNQPSNFNGSWSLDGGTLSVGNDNQLGNASGNLTLEGGRLRTTASLSSARAITVGPAGGTIDTLANNPTLSGAISGTGVLTKAGAGSVRLTNVRTGGLNISSGAVRVAPGGGFSGTSKVGSLTIDPLGALDIADHQLIVSGSSVGAVSSLVEIGRNGGFWNGAGITTSMSDATSGSNYTMLGVASGTDAIGIGASATAIWAGVTVTGSDALVMYTYGGDANLSGFVDIDDYGLIDFNASTGGVLTGWYNGDFDYNGVQDIDDYGVIDFVINIQGPAFATTGGMSVTSVPEPGGAGLLVASLSMLRRRRRALTPALSRGTGRGGHAGALS